MIPRYFISMNNVKYDILFEQVSCCDAAGVSVLQDVSFHIPANSLLALTGDQPCCEAVIALLTRDYELQSGCISIGGEPLHTAMIQCLSRENDHSADTICQYIANGCAGAGTMQVLEAADKARVLDFTWELPEGIHSSMRDISAGQLSCVRIARALLHAAPVVLLDSAFLFSEEGEERAIRQATAVLVKDKTVVMTRPTPAMLALADAVLVLKDGRVAAFSPRALLKGEE